MARTLNSKRQIVLIADNIRSCHNVGSLFRTAEGLAIMELVLVGYTPYPREKGDQRLNHVIEKSERQIAKTALGSQKSLKWRHEADLRFVLKEYKERDYRIYGLEQWPNSKLLPSLAPALKSVLVIGNEVSGLSPETIALCQELIEIPMLGRKESFNVVQAAAMALYHFRFR